VITLAQLNAMSDEEFVSCLAGVYEHSDWVAECVRISRPFTDVEDLCLAMQRSVDGAGDTEKLVLIQAHPDLAGKLARAGGLTDCSTREQAGLGLDRLSDEDYELFSARNEAYRRQFGFPFIVCARSTTQQGVLDAFERRMGNSRELEIAEALRQIHEIARLRLDDRIG